MRKLFLGRLLLTLRTGLFVSTYLLIFAFAHKSHSATLNWQLPADSEGVNIYRDGVYIRTVKDKTWFELATHELGSKYETIAIGIGARDFWEIHSWIDGSSQRSTGFAFELQWVESSRTSGYNIYRDGLHLATVSSNTHVYPVELGHNYSVTAFHHDLIWTVASQFTTTRRYNLPISGQKVQFVDGWLPGELGVLATHPTAEFYENNNYQPIPNYLSPDNLEHDSLRRIRVSDNHAFRVENGKAIHQYSRRQAWNSDESLLDIGNRLVNAHNFTLTDAELNLTTARVWSWLEPNYMFGFQYRDGVTNAFVKYDIRDGSNEDLITLHNHRQCTIGNAEGSLSIDDRYVVFSCLNENGNGNLISFDVKEKRILGILTTPNNFDWSSFSQSGDYILVDINGQTEGSDRLVRYNRTFNEPYVLTTERNHGDFGKDSNGDEVYVMIGGEVISYVRLRDGLRINLGVAGPESVFIGYGHVSCRNIHRPGWCYFSSERNGTVGAVQIGQQKNAGILPIDNGTVPLGLSVLEHWGFHRSTSASYEAQPKVVASPSGRQILYTSDWLGIGEINDYVIQIHPN